MSASAFKFNVGSAQDPISDEELRNLIDSGLSLVQITQYYPQQSLSQYRDRLGKAKFATSLSPALVAKTDRNRFSSLSTKIGVFSHAELAQMHAKGKTPVAMARELGVGAGPIRKRLQEVGVFRRWGRDGKIDHADLVDMYVNKGMSAAAVAKKMEVKSVAIVRRLRMLGVFIDLATRREKSLPPTEELRRLHIDEKKSAAQIAVMCHSGPKKIREELKAKGIYVRRPSGPLPAALSKDLLQSMHVARGLTPPQIGKKMGLSSETIRKHLRLHGIYRDGRITTQINNKE